MNESTEENTEERAKTRSRRVPLWLRIAGAVVVVWLVFVHIALPAIIISAIEDQLKALGAETVSVAALKVRPLRGHLELQQLEASDATGDTLVVGALELDVGVLALFSDQILVERAEVRGLTTDISISRAAIDIGPLHLPTAEAADADVATDEASDSEWGVGIDELTVVSTAFGVSHGDVMAEVEIEQLRLASFATWMPDQASELLLDMVLAGADVRLEGEVRPLSPSFDVAIDVGDLALASFAPLLPPEYATLDAQLDSLDGTLRVASANGDPVIRFDGEVIISRAHVPLAADLTIDLAQTSWVGRADADLGAGHIDAAGELTVTQLSLLSDDLDLSSGRMGWNGDARLRMAEGLVADIAGQILVDELTADAGADTSVSVRAVRAEYPFSEEALKETDAPWPIHVEQIDESVVATLYGRVRAEGIAGATTGVGLEELRSVTWDGTVDLTQDQAGFRVLDEGSLGIEAAAVRLPASGLTLGAEGIRWQGASDALLPSAGDVEVSLAGDASVIGASADRTDGSGRMAEAASISVIDARATAEGRYALGSLQVDTAVIGAPTSGEDPLLTFNTLHLDGVQLDGTELRIGPARMDEMQVAMITRADGTVPAIQALQGGAAAEDDADTSQDDGPALDLYLESFEVVGDSGIRIDDPSIPGGFSVDARIERLRIDQIAQSDPPRAELDLVLRLDEYQVVEMRGPVGYDAGDLALDVALTLSSIELPPLSQYSARSVAHYLHAGNLDAEAHIRLLARQLDVESDVRIRGLEVERISDELAEELQANTSVPLQFGLMLLKDNDGNIEIEVPVHGSLDDPNFDTSDAVWSAVRTAAAAGATTYFKFALGPFGAALVIGDLMSGSGGVSLEPVIFDAGTSTAPGSLTEYAAMLAGLMADRPALQLQACGFAVPADSVVEPGAPAPDQAALQALARDRATEVRRALVESHGLDAGRVIVCRPQVDEDPAASPRVDLSF
jgi:hypothetical protein